LCIGLAEGAVDLYNRKESVLHGSTTDTYPPRLSKEIEKLHTTCDSTDGYNGFSNRNHTNSEPHSPMHPDNQLHHPS
jgi:hypothetical protein